MIRSDHKAIVFCGMLVICFAILFLIVDKNITPGNAVAGDIKTDSVGAAAFEPETAEDATEEATKTTKRLCPFDPNTASAGALQELGLPLWMVKGILRYRAKGGTYSSAEDFARVPGLTQKQYKDLLPYIRIGDDYKPASLLVGERRPAGQHQERDTFPRQHKMQSAERLAVNEADTSELKQIPGIGSYFARKIVDHRNRLGGFVSLEQLLEIPNFPEAALQYLTIPDGGIKKINLNTADFKTVCAHPYIGYQRTKRIFDYRRLKGRIASKQQLKIIAGFSDEELARIEEYIEL